MCDVMLASYVVLIKKTCEQSMKPLRIGANQSHRELQHIEGNRRSGSADPYGRRSDSGDRRRRRRTARMRALTNRKRNTKSNTWGGRGAHGERSQLRGSSRGAATAANSATAAATGVGEVGGGGGAVGSCSLIPWRRRERGGRGS